MIRSQFLIVAGALLLSGWASAHAKITRTEPADGDFVAAPGRFVLEFDAAVHLTGVEIVKIEGDSRDIGTLPSAAARSFTLELPETLSPGEYYVVWKAIAADSHFSTGEFFFTVVKH